MRNMTAIFRKQIKDTLKNKTVFIQFIMFPLLTVLMKHTVQIDGMPENFFVNLFAAMYVGMAPLTSISAIIAEEKETNTLRVLLASNVRPHEYLLGVGSYVWLACMLGAGVICASGTYGLRESGIFLAAMGAGIAASLLIGAAIGTWSRTQMAATSVAVPVMMIFSFLPMLSMFDETAAKIAKYTYSEQIERILSQIPYGGMDAVNLWIIVANIAAAAGLFGIVYKKCSLA